MTQLTAHHLIPRKLHRRKHFKKKFSKDELQVTIPVCKKCHSGLHKLYDEMHLGKYLNTADKLLADPPVKKHIEWVSRQRSYWQ